LELGLEKNKEESINEVVRSYQVTNDRINNYLTFTGIFAMIFGVIIALAGIFIGFESLKSQRRRKEAIKTLEQAKQYVEGKKSDFDKTIDEKIKNIDSEYQKILKLSKERLLADVEAVTQKVKEVAQKKSKEIEDYSIEEKTDKTLESLQKRIEFFESIGIPDDPKILLSKAKLLSEKEMHNEAIELLEKLINIETENSDAHWQLGWVYSKIDNHPKSIEHYLKCIQIAPKTSSAHNNLAVQLENTDRPFDALKGYEKAIEINGTHKLYYRNKIRVLKQLNSNEEVLNTYKQLLELDKKDTNTYDEIIRFLQNQNQFNDSLEYYDLAIIEIEEKKEEFKYAKALILKQLNLFDEAIGIFQELINQNHKQDHCYLQIAGIKNEQGEKKEAIGILNSAISLNPKSSALYVQKASFQIERDEESAFKTILDGTEQIQGESYFQSAARFFSNNGRIKFAKRLYLEANLVIKNKLHEKREGDIMNYYEGLIITEQFEEADEFIEEHSPSIVGRNYKVVREFLNLCLKVVKGEVEDISAHTHEFEEYVQNDKSATIKWVFKDILIWIKAKTNESTFLVLTVIAELLMGDIDLEDFRSKIK
ncbi:MAG: tetratricopeptide repeat protein, partial [Nitrosopumilus sp.]